MPNGSNGKRVPESWPLRWYRRVTGLWPADLRREHQDDAVHGVEELLANERHQGRVAASVLWVKAMSDGVGTAVRERDRDSRWRGAFRDIGGDLRFVRRSWRRSPGFALTAAATLTVGLGLAVAMFSFADGYLFRGLPFPEPDQLYGMSEPASEPVGMVHASDVQAFRESAVASFGFVEWSVGRMIGTSLVVGDRRVPFFAYGVSPGFGQALGLPLEAGRWFTRDEYRDGPVRAAWLSDRFWNAQFGRDLSVIGHTFEIAGARGVTHLQIVGVMSELISSFDLNNEPPDIVVPDAQPPRSGPNFFSSALIRLPSGMSRAEGEARLNAVYHALPPAPGPRPWTRGTITLRSLREMQVSGGRPTARVLLSGAVLILLLVAANLVHLLLARGAARAAEVSVRSAIGASRWRTIRLFMTESLLLGLIGILGGLVAGRWLSLLISANVPRFPTRGRNLSLVPMIFDIRVLAFAIVVGLLLAVFGGLWPAWRASRQPLGASIRNASASQAALRTRTVRVLLASELTLATVVMAGAVFLGMGIWRFVHQPIGFDLHDRFYVSVEPKATVSGARAPFVNLDPLIPDLAKIPGIASVTDTLRYRSAVDGAIAVDGRALSTRAAAAYAMHAGAFRTWGVDLKAGRVLTDEEIAIHAPLAVVDEQLAGLAWPGREAVGQTLSVGGSGPLTVIGVIAPVLRSLTFPQPAQAFVADTPAAGASPSAGLLAVWAPGLSEDALRSRVAPLIGQSGLGVLHLEASTFASEFLRDSGEALFQGPIVTAFGILAFIVAGVGLFGLVSYLVERRRREFGIRIALGARSTDVWRSVMRESLMPAVVGLVTGLALARVLDVYVRSKVFGWDASGTAAATIVGALLLFVAVLASLVPARRAMRVDPIEVLRAE